MKLKNIPSVSGLVITAILNTKIAAEVENKIPHVNELFKKGNYDTKIIDIKGKYFSTAGYSKFKSDILDER